jgi:peptidoglycan/LPS O-acetylase OafA/YrhL
MEPGRRVNEIDLLRFLAAFAVVFHYYAFRGHAADNLTVLWYFALVPVAKYGYLGVDLFFMISGFVIVMTVSDGTLRHFVVSRVTKLYPAFWICCTITFVVSLAIGGERFPVSVMQYLGNMLRLGGVFGVAAIDGAYWSLHIEMWFYAFVAIMLVFGALKRAQLLLWAWLAAFALAIQLDVHVLKAVLIADNAAYFVAGAVLFMIWLHGPSASRVALLCASFCGSIHDAINFVRAESVHDKTAIGLYVMVAIVTGFFGMMLLVALRRTGALRERRWLMLGAMSYPLYLIHQGIG